jgi:RNA ligase (TIGR02306 family)
MVGLSENVGYLKKNFWKNFEMRYYYSYLCGVKYLKMENLNSVCYVGIIGEVKPIEGADNIELALVGGWQAITKKGEYEVGDMVVIATTDAVIPQKLSDDLGVTSYLRKGQRVRTIKLRKVYSECLIIPIGFVPEKYRYDGSDCMELLEVFKYEPPVRMVQLSGGKKIKYSQNPNFHIYYKFPNLKNVPEMFNEDDIVTVTRKLHGTNARFGIVKKKKLSIFDRVKKLFGNKWVNYEYVLGSHNVEKGSESQGFYSTDVWKTISDNYKIKDRLWDYVKKYGSPDYLGDGLIIYGEIYGHGIQKNYDYGLTDIKFAGFDVELNGDYQPYHGERNVFQSLGLPRVEVLYLGTWSKEKQDKYVFNNNIEGTKVPHEGVVVKSVTGDRHKVGKVINPDYTIFSEKNNVGDSH